MTTPREWSPWRAKPLKQEELDKLLRTLRDLRVGHWSMTRYARYYQGAPDVLLPHLKLAVWLLGSSVSPRQEAQQAAMRGLGWHVVVVDTCAAVMDVVNKAKGH